MILILYQADHVDRALQLAGITPKSRATSISCPPKSMPGVDTIVLWGHGDENKLCGKNVQQMVEVISGWRRKNSAIKTIEVLTCNGSHSSDAWEKYSKHQSFVVRLKASFGWKTRTRGLTVKAMPTCSSGSHNAWSILLYDKVTMTWAYVTGPGKKDTDSMSKASVPIKYGLMPDKTKMIKGYSLVDRAQALKKMQTHKDKWTVNYGHLKTLRHCLVKV